MNEARCCATILSTIKDPVSCDTYGRFERCTDVADVGHSVRWIFRPAAAKSARGIDYPIQSEWRRTSAKNQAHPM